MVNGYRFHTRDYGQHKATMNSGVCCRGSLYGDKEMEYYWVIEEILELAYVGQGNNVFILVAAGLIPSVGLDMMTNTN
ncbi:hypothetical protein CDL12_28329 [Handroanthus impetiginosus]|uniref:Uncharacterized protein n=1 Tax=Handroanthus impetiginosus TaxID=429701 RepID=A0A2G9G1J8_9LAMI|nr:hypothetical protein CDL12_28329 [Handroanthus impetiginosus]